MKVDADGPLEHFTLGLKICKRCFNFCDECLPGTPVPEICEMTRAEDSEDIKGALDAFDNEKKVEELNARSLTGHREDARGAELHVKHLALTAKEVQNEYNKPPKTLGM
eukprot:3424480-Pyramimonas_sp.AAC.1